MNNVLLIGNGFDLAHGLPTSYNDFLFIMKNWNIFCARYKSAKRGRTLDETDVYYKYLTDVDIVNEKNVDILGEIIKRNNWVKYYCGCEAEIDGWIDFEREIYPVLQLVEKIFNTVYKTLNSGTDMAEVHIPKEHILVEYN